uniref:Uncharacterized protein n=1 Tax=Cajanus cajan TaxID=3821 RepID=A0A151TWI6_CAJCA|nr:hypothetical protein KK1_010569 [Cajanus cajan]
MANVIIMSGFLPRPITHTTSFQFPNHSTRSQLVILSCFLGYRESNIPSTSSKVTDDGELYYQVEYELRLQVPENVFFRKKMIFIKS